MQSRDFVYWLQGYLEITKAGRLGRNLDALQVECIEKHLNMVFIHEIDPSFPAEQQEALDKAHNPPPLTDAVKAKIIEGLKKIPKSKEDDGFDYTKSTLIRC